MIAVTAIALSVDKGKDLFEEASLKEHIQNFHGSKCFNQSHKQCWPMKKREQVT